MGGVFHYNPVTGYGYYMDDKEIAEAGGRVLLGIGAFVILYYIAFFVVLILISPFITLFLLDDFVETIIVNNSWLFIGIGVLLIAFKSSTKTYSVRIVRIFFDIYVIVSVLYLILYVLNFEVTVFSYVRIIDNYLPAEPDEELMSFLGIDNLIEITEGHWFYNFASSCINGFLELVKTTITKLIYIDNSCFSVPIAEINIFEVIKTLCLLQQPQLLNLQHLL